MYVNCAFYTLSYVYTACGAQVYPEILHFWRRASGTPGVLTALEDEGYERCINVLSQGYYCDEDCPSILEYLLCPETEACDEDDEAIEWTRNENDPELDVVITLR